MTMITNSSSVPLSRMPPAARVGQLFIVTFPGTDTAETSAIYDLIVNERIGGVLLSPDNGNILNEGNAPAQVATLTSQLQRLAWDAAQIPLPVSEGKTATSPYVPLFIAVRQGERIGLPTLPISGTTPLPSPMAIGATWNPAHAEAVGQIVGKELHALGINLFLGPMLEGIL
jgi:Beta-glucosidase-related glycosidases